MRFVPKYLELLGATAGAIAFYGAFKDLLDALYPYPGGWAADHFGRRLSLIGFTLLSAVGYLVYFGATHWVWVIAGTVLVMGWSSLTQPAIFALIGDQLAGHQRAIGFGVQSTVKRLPIIIAPPLGGWLVAHYGMGAGVRIGLVVSMACALASITILRRINSVPHPPATRASLPQLWKGMNPGLKKLLVADILARWAEGLPKVFIVLYVLDVLHQGSVRFGWLISVQMIVSLLSYIPAAKLADHLNRKPLVLATFLFFSLFPLMLVHAHTLPLLVIAFMVAGLREFGEPARKSLIVDLADAGARGRSVGIYYLVRGIAVFPAALVGGYLWKHSASLPFYVAFVVGLLSIAAYAVWGPGSEKTVKTLPA